MTRVYLGLGSNLGDRNAHLRAGLEVVASQVAVVSVSPVYETAPVGGRNLRAHQDVRSHRLPAVLEAREDGDRAERQVPPVGGHRDVNHVPARSNRQ